MDRAKPQVDEPLCSRCGLCIEACPCGSVELKEQGLVFACPELCATAEQQACTCGCVCEEVCPTGAIRCVYEIVLGDGSLQTESGCGS